MVKSSTKVARKLMSKNVSNTNNIQISIFIVCIPFIKICKTYTIYIDTIRYGNFYI